jgi:hypothetical protein
MTENVPRIVSAAAFGLIVSAIAGQHSIRVVYECLSQGGGNVLRADDIVFSALTLHLVILGILGIGAGIALWIIVKWLFGDGA